MTLIFNPRRARVVTHTHYTYKGQVQSSVVGINCRIWTTSGSGTFQTAAYKQTDRRKGATDCITFPANVTRPVISISAQYTREFITRLEDELLARTYSRLQSIKQTNGRQVVTCMYIINGGQQKASGEFGTWNERLPPDIRQQERRLQQERATKQVRVNWAA